MISMEWNADEVTDQVKDLIEAYKRLPEKLSKKYLRRAMRTAVSGFEPALRGNTPYRTGSLMRSIRTTLKLNKKSGGVAAEIGFSRGSLKKKRGQFVVSGSGHHAIIVERGTKDRRRRNGAFCGRMPGRFMLQDTLAAKKSEILSSLSGQLASCLEKAAKELAKGGAK